MLSTWLEHIKQKVKKDNFDMWVFILYELKEGITYEYHIIPEDVEVIVSAGILSRGKDIMPKVEELFN